MKTVKFMQTVDDGYHAKLKRIAKEKGTTVQQLIRTIIVPEWYRWERRKEWQRRAKRRTRQRERDAEKELS